jgi:hypothetical protein
MKFRSKKILFLSLTVAGVFYLNSCSKHNNNDSSSLASTPLYDTLGWFIQGGTGAVKGQGTVMVADPMNSGQTIQAGRLAIRTVVNQALGVVAADPKMANYFPTLLAEVGAGTTTGLSHLLNTFTDFVQQAVSGQKIYMGLSMSAAHNFSTNARFGSSSHMTADSADFNNFIGDIVSAATSLKVPNSVIGQLGVILYTTEGDIVQDKTSTMATTPLYDTLGWFIQGATGAISGQGVKLVADPSNSGQQIQAGRLAIRTVVDKALGIIAADPKLSPYFPTLLGEVNAGNTTGYSHLLNFFTDFVQQGASGQHVYNGKSMTVAHNFATYSRFGSAAHPAADSTDFNQFIGDVVTAAQSYNVPNSVIGQLGVLLVSVEGAVVQKK